MNNLKHKIKRLTSQFVGCKDKVSALSGSVRYHIEDKMNMMEHFYKFRMIFSLVENQIEGNILFSLGSHFFSISLLVFECQVFI